MKKVICLDNSLVNNKDSYKVCGIYSLIDIQNRSNRICYVLENADSKTGDHIVTAVDMLNGKVYFEPLEKYRSRVINTVLNEI